MNLRDVGHRKDDTCPNGHRGERIGASVKQMYFCDECEVKWKLVDSSESQL